jgi:hypothetical protein
VRIAEIVVAGLLALVGVRSLVRWLGVHFEGTSVSDHLLYSVHVTARVGIWFALAGAFLGYAIIDAPQDFAWFVLVPVILAGTQLLTGILLSRQPSGPGKPSEPD